MRKFFLLALLTITAALSFGASTASAHNIFCDGFPSPPWREGTVRGGTGFIVCSDKPELLKITICLDKVSNTTGTWQQVQCGSKSVVAATVNHTISGTCITSANTRYWRTRLIGQATHHGITTSRTYLKTGYLNCA